MLDDSLSDAGLVAAVADVVRHPRTDPATSFVLHAPLELAARAALLPHVMPDARAEARRRLVELGQAYERAGEPIPEPPARDLGSPAAAADRLRAAIDAGDLPEVDVTARWLGLTASPSALRSLLADTLVPRLAAAAHAPIFLFQLPRVSPRGELTGELLRPLARELARSPEWRLGWHAGLRPRDPTLAPGALWDALASTPRIGLPGSDFVFPIMAQVDGEIATGLLAGVVGAVEISTGATTIMRAAARCMLDEPEDHAPYGWSHCLTLPQAVLGIADACHDRVAPLAVASTFVVGFRAALAAGPLGADVAVAAPEETVAELVAYAATHHDAHLVKYTLACLDAAAWDPPRRGLYLTAAARLGRYWRARDDAPATRDA